MSRYKQTDENRGLDLRKKLVLFLLIFSLFQGIVIVDNAYQNMLAEDYQMFFGIKRINEDRVKIVLFGEEQVLNVGETYDEIHNYLNQLSNKTSIYIYKAKYGILKYFKKNKTFNGLEKI
ncbi:MAG: hypothetical protein WC996_03965 [Peptostreptococcales bacterium]